LHIVSLFLKIIVKIYAHLSIIMVTIIGIAYTNTLLSDKKATSAEISPNQNPARKKPIQPNDHHIR